MNSVLNKICITALAVELYCIIPWWSEDIETGTTWVTGTILLITIILNILFAIIAGMRAKKSIKIYRSLLTDMLYAKLILIPFFCIFFVLMFAVGLATVWMGVGFLLWIVAIVISAFIMLMTSLYSVAAIITAPNGMFFSKAEKVGHIIAQFVFMVDVADAIYLFIVLRKKSRKIMEEGIAENNMESGNINNIEM